jgi:coenzyme F420-reducing hydrogenase alpha subunit
MSEAPRTIRVPILARVEGEGSLRIAIRDGRVREVRLGIFEPPRFFEGILRGRSFEEVPDIVARICGICPVAYQITAARAIEDALGVIVEPGVRVLRRLLYCGEWISSHALHVVLLHAPDFLGYEDGIRMAKDHPDRVAAGLQLKKLGNAIMIAVGGREIHPISVKVGGMWKTPPARELEPLRDRIERGRDQAVELARWVASFNFPASAIDLPLVALAAPGAYPLDFGRIVSTTGLDIGAAAFDAHFAETQVGHSNAMHSGFRSGGSYVVGPMARFALNHALLGSAAAETAREAGLVPEERNPFRSIVVRAIEVVWACEEALRCLDGYRPPERPFVAAVPRPATGHAVTEAPRGLLYHRYRLDARGTILDAKIVPPTSQNLRAIELDLETFAGTRLGSPREELARACEDAVRNYDPCISCATHALKVSVEEW